MSDDTELELKITANASGVAPAAAEAKDAMEGLGAAGAESLRHLVEETEREEMSLKELVLQVHEGVESFNEFKAAISEVAEVYMAAFMVERLVDMAKEMGEAGEEVEHMALTLGMTIAQVQSLDTVSVAMTGSSDTLQMSVMRLQRAFGMAQEGSKRQADAFETLGISTKEAVDPMKLVQETMESLGQIEDPMVRNTLSMELFGRGVKEIAPLLEMTKQQWEENAKLGEKYGTVNEEAAEKEAVLGRQFNENKLAMQGLGNVMGDALAPALSVIVSGTNDLIASWVKSYETGGIVREIMDALSGTIKATISIIVTLGLAFDTVWKSIEGAAWVGAGLVQAAITAIIVHFKYLNEALDTVGRVMMDVFTGHWDQIQSDYQNGINKIVALSQQAAHQMGREAGAGWKKGWDEILSATSDYNASNDFLKKLWGPGMMPKAEEHEEKRKVTLPNEEGSKGPDRVEQLKAELQQKLLLEENWGTDVAQFTERFWQNVLSTESLSAKQRLAVQMELLAAKKEIFKEEQQDSIANIKAQEAISLEYAKTDISIAKMSAEQKKSLLDEQVRQGQISAVQAAQQKSVIDQQLIAMDRDLADQEFQIRLRAMQDELALEHLTPIERANINRQIEELEAQHQNKMRELSAQAALQRQKDASDIARAQQESARKTEEAWRRAIDPVGHTFASTITGMITHTRTLQQSMLQVGQSILQSSVNWMTRMAEDWVIKHVMMRYASQEFSMFMKMLGLGDLVQSKMTSSMMAVGDIQNSAARAGAAAFASTAAIPIIGPALAPEVAAAAVTQAMGFTTMVAASARGGWGEVPYDGAITELHKQEMVLPASIASPLRAAINNSSGGGGLGGDTHIHNWHLHAIDGKDVQSFFDKHSDKVVRSLNSSLRRGAKLVTP